MSGVAEVHRHGVGPGEVDTGGEGRLDQAGVLTTRAPDTALDAALPPAIPVRERSAPGTAESAAFEEYTFFTVFQPIVELTTNEVVGYEALARFADGQSPQERLAAARSAGVGTELDAALALAALGSAGSLPTGAWLSVNVSPALANQPGKLAEILGAAPCPLVIDVGDAMDLVDGSLAELPGALVAIDDAGAGYESLSRIARFRPAFMKLHRGAVSGIEADLARQAFVRTLVDFADRHGCQIIAEGVETEAERDALRDAGVHLAQGYFVGRPAPVDRMRGALGASERS
jgi:EAL domain-containing protein (putative c-di-GMP-specific phosphodiesterase class I)